MVTDRYQLSHRIANLGRDLINLSHDLGTQNNLGRGKNIIQLINPSGTDNGGGDKIMLLASGRCQSHRRQTGSLGNVHKTRS